MKVIYNYVNIGIVIQNYSMIVIFISLITFYKKYVII